MRLESELMAMSHLVLEATDLAVRALKHRDLEGSKTVIHRDQEMNRRRHDIEMDCLKLIATQQPMASDLRSLSATMAIAGELERIHDYAKGIGKISLLIGHEQMMGPLQELPEMAKIVCELLKRAMIAYSRRDINAARQISKEDDLVDAKYHRIYHDIFSQILEDSKWLQQGNYLMWAAHNLERAADRITNICERIIYLETGLLVELDRDETIVFPLTGEADTSE